MEYILEQVIQYVNSILEDLNDYLKETPPEILWAAAGFFILLFLVMQIRKFSVKRKKNKAADHHEKIEGSDQVPEALLEAEDFEEAGEIREVESPDAEEAGLLEVDETEVLEQVEEITTEIEPEGFFSRLKSGLSKTRNTFTGGLDRIFSSAQKIDDDLMEEIEELLITSDIGVQTTMSLVQKISEKASDISDSEELKRVLKTEILALIKNANVPAEKKEQPVPRIIMVVGVNGVGKTTTIGKLSARFKQEGLKVLIVAADTFRAAAGEQLAIWAEKSGAQIVKHRDGADPASVAYDGVEAAIARGIDVVLVDTAGRLHTKLNLMEELKKIRRTIAKKIPDAPHEILMILDATTGQNALIQAKMFHEALGLTSIALTKLDGTAKGGIVIAICDELNIPLEYIGVGEKLDDLQEFDPDRFVEALF
ncbi:MAG: signal recognition particle-docking protein FtsY [Desulfobacterales bacterium]